MRFPRALIPAVLVVLVVLVVLIVGCGGALPQAGGAPPSDASARRYPLTVTDDEGRARTLTKAPARVVSLAPSATEIVYALGAGDRLVAVDDFSNYPAEAKALPKLGGFRASPEGIVATRPDLILAITSGNLAQQLDALGQPVVVLDPVGLSGVYENILLIGRLLDRDSAAQKLVGEMRGTIEGIAAKTRNASRPRVLHEVDATNPTQIYVAGPRSYIDEIITVAGGTNVAAASLTKYPKLSAEAIVRGNPEIIVLSDAAFGVTTQMVAARPGYSAISAVRNQKIIPIDDDLVSRPGPRMVQGVQAYARILHPELFP